VSLHAFGSGLVLTAIGRSSLEHVRFTFWTLRTDERWRLRGGLSITAPPDNQPLVRFVVRPGRWLVYGQISPVVCCGGAQPGGEALASAGLAAEATTWAWVSGDGSRWTRQRLGAVANDLLHVVAVGSSFWGVAHPEGQPSLVRSQDGTKWRRRFPLPDRLNRSFAYQLVSTRHGLLVSGLTRDAVAGSWHETVWSYDLDGNVDIAADLPGVRLDSFAVSQDGRDIVGVGSRNSQAGLLAQPITIVSRDGGATFAGPLPIAPAPGRMNDLVAAIFADTILVAPAQRVTVYRATLVDAVPDP
jgi:hypothetical protein